MSNTLSRFSVRPPRFSRSLALLAGVAVAGLFVAESCWFTVGQNERAFVRQFGRVVDVPAGPIGPGIHFKQPFFTSVDKLSVSIDVLDAGNIDAFTRDAQKVTMHVTVTVQIPDTAVYHLLYEVGRAGNVDLEHSYVTIVSDRLRTVIGRHEINAIAGADRQEILDETRVALTRSMTRRTRFV